VTSENQPLKGGTYQKCAVPSAWVKQRGMTEDTPKRFEEFEDSNPAYQLATSRSSTDATTPSHRPCPNVNAVVAAASP
jgi:hypothetical protein